MTEVSERLQNYSRYLAVLAEELEALKVRDAPLLQRLADDRRALETALTAAGAGDEIAALVDDGLRRLESVAEHDDQARMRWIELEHGTMRAARGLRLHRRAAGRYGELLSSDGGKFDVRF